jgi:phospholipase D1/2
VIGTFLVLELVAFPVTLLIAATAAAFGPWLGFLYAASGAMLSAIATYAVGALLGKETLRQVLGRRMRGIRRVMKRQGVLTVAAIRLVPIAPFAVVNAVAGALQVRFIDFVCGTAIGMAPGLLLMSALGHQITQVLIRPTTFGLMLLAIGIVVWIGIAVAAQAAVARYTRGGP